MADDEELYINKYNVFMGTIMICIVYAVIALGILLFSYFSETGKNLFVEQLKPFIITFVIGTLLVIIVMTSLVIDWKPEEKDKIKVKSIQGINSCPDYWNSDKQTKDKIDNMVANLEYVDDATTPAFNVLDSTTLTGTDKGFYDDKVDKKLLKNKCNYDEDVYKTYVSSTDDKPGDTTDGWKKNDIYSTQLTSGNLEGDDQKTFVKAMLHMSAPESVSTVVGEDTKVTKSTPLKCDRVFPEYLEKLDAEEYADNNFQGKSNKFRCEYAKVCGVPWTSAGC
tara:strand:- start:5952 stop:6791 length:840 start_codon:yes stop_codon:yes gene_type:complete